jgi:hypothetical protein
MIGHDGCEYQLYQLTSCGFGHEFSFPPQQLSSYFIKKRHEVDSPKLIKV